MSLHAFQKTGKIRSQIKAVSSLFSYWSTASEQLCQETINNCLLFHCFFSGGGENRGILGHHMSIPLSNSACCPVSWGCRIHWLLLCKGVRPPSNECPGYDTKQSHGDVPAMLELWGMWSTPSLPSLPGPLWPGVVAPDRALSMG